MPFDILLVSIARTLVEVAGFALLGQGVVALLAGKTREQNLFYRLLRTAASPAVCFVTPRFILAPTCPCSASFCCSGCGSRWPSPSAICASSKGPPAKLSDASPA